MQKRSRKKRIDLNELASSIVGEATNPAPPKPETDNSGKDPHAVALGRMGGLVGGKARWKGTTKKQRSEAARKAARARWGKKSRRSGK